MNEEQMQPEMNTEMTPDEHAAALGFISTLSRQHMMQEQPQEAPESPESAPQQEQQPEPQKDLTPRIDDLESKIMGEIGMLKEEIQKSAPKDKDTELEDLKNQIAEVLAQSDDHE